MAEKFSGTSRELVPATLRGFRSWRVEGSRLIAVVRNYTWDVGINTARCYFGDALRLPQDVHSEEIPSKDCTCGFYACYSFFNSNIPMADIFGSVKASGLVVIGTEGFRAEKVEVEALWSTNRRHQYIADRYGVPFYHRSAVPFIKYGPTDLRAIMNDEGKKSPSGPLVGWLRRTYSWLERI
jgi:hypothetical protein